MMDYRKAINAYLKRNFMTRYELHKESGISLKTINTATSCGSIMVCTALRLTNYLGLDHETLDYSSCSNKEYALNGTTPAHEVIFKRIRELGLSPKQICLACDMPKSSLANFVYGRVKYLSDDMAERFIDGLGIDPDELEDAMFKSGGHQRVTRETTETYKQLSNMRF